MAENIFDRIVIERVDLDINIGPKTYKLSGDKEFINLATRNKSDLFFLLKEIVKKIGYTPYVNGQKAWNGVAILSKDPLNITNKSIPK